MKIDLKKAAAALRMLADALDNGAAHPERPKAPVARSETKPTDRSHWKTYVLTLKNPIGKPKAARIIERVALTESAQEQFKIVIGQGSGEHQAVIAITVTTSDGMETARMVAEKFNRRGSDPKARAPVVKVEEE